MQGTQYPVTVLIWPSGKARRRRKPLTGPPVLDSLVTGLPGPNDETDVERAARFEAQMAAVLTLGPRDVTEAMIAVQSVVLGQLADPTRQAVHPGLASAEEKKILREAMRIDKRVTDCRETLLRRQATPQAAMHLANYPVLSPEDPDQDKEAVNAVIVPLHLAPKMLQ
jgi:hypothetical protein